MISKLFLSHFKELWLWILPTQIPPFWAQGYPDKLNFPAPLPTRYSHDYTHINRMSMEAICLFLKPLYLESLCYSSLVWWKFEPRSGILKMTFNMWFDSNWGNRSQAARFVWARQQWQVVYVTYPQQSQIIVSTICIIHTAQPCWTREGAPHRNEHQEDAHGGVLACSFYYIGFCSDFY